jgi:DNA-binding NarL/FixJ family response regulator
MSTRLLIAEDHELIRAGLREFFRGTEIEIVGEATTEHDAVTLAAQSDVVLLSPLLTERLDTLAQIKSKNPGVAVLLFSTHRSPALIAKGIAGEASGIVSKEADRDALLRLIRGAAGGQTLWSRDELRRAGAANRGGAVDVDVQLTRRETEVLAKLVDGLTNKQIAQELDISYETVKEHVQHILRKIGVTDRTQAAVWAVRQKLV